MNHPQDYPDLTTTRGRVVFLARASVGLLYKWGGNVPADGGMDCSGFVQWLYAQAGIAPWATEYPNRLDLTAAGIFDQLDAVPREEHVLPADLAFYGSASRGKIVHVVVVTAIAPGGEVRELVGASRGFRGLADLNLAQREARRVRTFNSVVYRNDFVAFRRCPT